MAGTTSGRARYPRLKLGGLIAGTAHHWGDINLPAARLQPPHLPPDVVRRGQLVNRVLTTSGPIVSITAPAGYGKTLLLAQCAAAAESRVAWLKLEASDNDPSVLVSDIGQATCERPLELPELLQAMTYAPTTLLLLDNADAVASPRAIDALTTLCEQLPWGWRIIAASRAAPPLAMARLRAQGLLLDIGVMELAFTRREARQLLHTAHVLLDADAFETVYTRCEGWVTGIFLSTLGGESASVEFLTAEVLSGLSEEQRAVLGHAAQLDRFCASLCDALLERTDSGVRIAEIERSTGLSNRWTSTTSGSVCIRCSAPRAANWYLARWRTGSSTRVRPAGTRRMTLRPKLSSTLSPPATDFVPRSSWRFTCARSPRRGWGPSYTIGLTCCPKTTWSRILPRPPRQRGSWASTASERAPDAISVCWSKRTVMAHFHLASGQVALPSRC